MEPVQRQNPLDEFYEFLKQTVDSFDALRTLLSDQIEAVEQADIGAIDANMRAEQVIALRMEKFESRLEQHFHRLSTKANTLTEFIAQIPRQEQYRFYDLLGRFAATAQDVAVYKEQCQALLEVKLHLVEKEIELRGGAQCTVYGRDALHLESSHRILRTEV